LAKANNLPGVLSEPWSENRVDRLTDHRSLITVHFREAGL
jgi:hypothetical protein